MIIGIDGNEANEVRGDIGSRAGSNVVAFQMLWALFNQRKFWKDKHKIIIFLKKTPQKDMPPRGKGHFEYKVLGDSPFWVATKLMWDLFKKDRPDILHTFSHYLPPLSPIPMGCTIHDLGFLKYSGQFKRRDFWQLKYWTAMSINVSKYIISVSKYTKRDLEENFPRTKGRIHVIPNSYDKDTVGNDYPRKEINKVLKKYSIDTDFIFFLSTLKPSKNIERLIEGFSKLTDKEKVKLVISGGKGWMYEEALALVDKLGINKKVIFTGVISGREKEILLKEAKLLVSPSYWEGFGIHVLESLASGTPVVISDRASLPEVAGDAAVYVNPDSTDSIVSGIERIINMSSLEYNRLVRKGLERSRKFSWDVSAKKLLKVMEKISGK